MEQIYFEAGKITGSSYRAFLLSGIILIVFLLDTGKSDLTVPFINLHLAYHYALATMFFIHASFLFRFVAAVNYERELRERIYNENHKSNKTVWLLSYPSVINFHHFSDSMMSRNNHLILQSILIIQFFFLAFALPAWAAIKLVSLNWGVSNWSFPVLLLNVVSCTLVTLTFQGLIKSKSPRAKKTKTDN